MLYSFLNSLDTSELDQQIEDGKQATQTACKYLDWLLSTVNPLPPQENMWIGLRMHPCQKLHEDIHDDEVDPDYIDLLTVQIHTKCTSYCLRKK